MMPQQVVGPAARFTLGIGVRAPEKEGLDVHRLDREFARVDPLFHPLMARVKAAGVPDHADQTGFLLLGKPPGHRPSYRPPGFRPRHACRHPSPVIA